MTAGELGRDVRTKASRLLAVLGTSLALAAAQGATAIAMLLLARHLPIRTYGVFAALYTASYSLSLLLDFGSTTRWTRELARSRDISSYRDWLQRRTLAQVPFVVVFAVVAVLLVGDRLQSSLAVVILAGQALTSTFSSGSLAPVQALQSPVRAAWFVAAGNAFFAVCVALSPGSYLVVVAAIGATGSWLITAMLGLTTARHLHVVPRKRSPSNPWSGSSGFGVFRIAIAVQPFDLVLVGAFAGATEAGQIAAVSKWVAPVYLFAAGYTNNLFPVMAAVPRHEAVAHLRSTVIHLLLIATAAALAIFIAAPWLIRTLLGAGYVGSVLFLRLLSVQSVLVAVLQPCVTFLQARGQEHFVAVTTLVATAGYLLAIIIFAGAFGAPVVPVIGIVECVVVILFLLHRIRRAEPETCASE